MGRIAGVINTSVAISSLEAMVKGMCQLFKHGDFNEEEIYVNVDTHFALGYRPLSLIDLSNGHQPMSYANNRYHISYDGELYNNLELKEELKKVDQYFKSESDTEVILAAFVNWGVNAFSRFNGMFAFALWDNETNELYLVRDSMGIKPLYYAHTSQGIAFASEIKAFSAIPYLQEKNNKSAVYLMAYGHLPEPITTLKEVKSLEKGTWLKYHVLSGIVEVETFKQFSYLEKINDREDAISLIKNHLNNSVQKHLLSNTLVGVLLNGSIESSILALLANKTHRDLQTISISLEDKVYPEKKYQNILQHTQSFIQHQHLLTEADFHNYLSDIINVMDMPSCDIINTWFISKCAKENGLKAVLSGVGGNELYGGYPSFDRIKLTLFLQGLPNKVLRATTNSSLKKIRRASYLSINGAIGKYLFLRGQFTPSEIAKYLNANESEVWEILEKQQAPKNIDYLTPGNQASWMETNLYMQNQLLRDADVVSMAHGVEIRFPFLDLPFVNCSLHIDSSIKYSGKSKQLLVDSFKDILPEPIWNRSKIELSSPYKKWLGDDRYVKSRNGKYMGEYLSKMRSGDIHWSQFFTLLLMEK